MLVVVSPAKNLDFDTPATTESFTQPDLLDDSQSLINRCKELTPAEIASLMKISDKLAGLNADRFHSWHQPFNPDNAKQAVLAFNGDVYAGLHAQSLSQQDLEFAQQHMRILSGLYGLLRPLDLMQPYRLEMGTKLSNERGANLYQFWGNLITERLNQALQEQGDNVLINLASNEYFKSVRTTSLNAEVITPIFKDRKNGQYKIISFFAKKARGLMTRFIIENRLSDPQQLLQFAVDGYTYNPQLSSLEQPVFCRDEMGG